MELSMPSDCLEDTTTTRTTIFHSLSFLAFYDIFWLSCIQIERVGIVSNSHMFFFLHDCFTYTFIFVLTSIDIRKKQEAFGFCLYDTRVNICG